jgi:hypothetical protein
MVTFKQFFESISFGCEHSEVLALINQFKENIKNTSLSNDAKYLPVRMIIDCMQEGNLDKKDLEKLSYWLKYKANSDYFIRVKNTAILQLLDKYEKASLRGIPKLEIPYDPTKPSFFVILKQNIDPRSVIKSNQAYSWMGSWDVYRKYGDRVDVAMKIPFKADVVHDALAKNQSIMDYIKETDDVDNINDFLDENSDLVAIETYMPNKDRVIYSVLQSNGNLVKGLGVDSYLPAIFDDLDLNLHIMKKLRDKHKYEPVLYHVINDTGE